MLKFKTVIFFILFCFISSAAMANFYIDGFGCYSDMQDKDGTPQMGMYGAGLSFALNVYKSYNIIAKSLYTSGTKTFSGGGELNEWHVNALLGIEFMPDISFFVNNRIIWRTSFLAGMGYTENSMEQSGFPTNDMDDLAVSFALTTGFQYIMSQNILPYVELGLYAPFYQGDLKESENYFWQIMVGIRYAVSSIRKAGDSF